MYQLKKTHTHTSLHLIFYCSTNDMLNTQDLQRPTLQTDVFLCCTQYTHTTSDMMEKLIWDVTQQHPNKHCIC